MSTPRSQQGGAVETRPGFLTRSLDNIERLGNKIPDPFVLFLLLFALVAVASSALSALGATYVVPGSEDGAQEIRGFFTAEGLTWLTTNLVPNFIGFPPLGVVLTILLGVGIAQRTGLLNTLVRRAFSGAPQWLLPYVAALVAVSGSIMSDAAMVVIPPLAAMVFKAAGRHPVAGLLGSFAAAMAAFSCSPFITSTDALLSGITNTAAASVEGLGTTHVSPISNHFLTFTIAIVLSVVAGFLIDRVLEPALVRRGVSREQTGAEDGSAANGTAEERPDLKMDAELTPSERGGMRWAGIALVLTVVAVLLVTLPPGAPMRNGDGAFLPESPLLSSVVFLVFLTLAVPGVAYGLATRAIRGGADVARMMGHTVKEMSGFVVLAFVMAQFLELFNWTGLSTWIAIKGAEALEATGFTGFGAILCFILLAWLINFFIISGSAQWALFAVVFVPMFALLGYEPGFVQAAYRIGDSTSSVLSPLNPYVIIVLGFLKSYEPKAGIGTVIARCLPFSLVFLVMWVAVFAVFYFGGLPIGPGMYPRL
ncbi:AbgT family transporter [Nocardiopsis prasina]|uniref:AbgT family transporter n=1 Tax=Nocardiopsis prasina TaxID=2015 RepID=UPI000348A373|nr:AbgT family transporter [Nocardiopsis prasina]